jgi:hypothetical protein
MRKFELNLAASVCHAGKEIGHAGSGTLKGVPAERRDQSNKQDSLVAKDRSQDESRDDPETESRAGAWQIMF